MKFIRSLFLGAVLLFLFSPAVFSQGGNYANQIFRSSGGTGFPVVTAGSSALITICTAAATGTPCTPLATIYGDAALTVPAMNNAVTPYVCSTTGTSCAPTTNPFYSDAYGNYDLWVPPGNYQIQIRGTGLTTSTKLFSVACVPLSATSCGALVNAANVWTNTNTFSGNLFANPIISTTANPASIGTLRLANTDVITWRNSANTGDSTLGQLGGAVGNIPADSLLYNGQLGSIVVEPSSGFSSFNASTAVSGLFRLGNTEKACWRNGADTDDVCSGMTSNNLPSPRFGLPSFVFVASNFTSANSTSAQNISGLAWQNPANTSFSQEFDCFLAYSQAVGTAAVTFSFNDVSTAPTSFFSSGHIQTNTTAFTEASATSTTTGAFTVVTVTPNATATVYTVNLHGLLEQPSGVSSAISIMVTQATGADLITIKRGSYCVIH